MTHPESARCVLDGRQPGRPVDGPRSRVCADHRARLAELLDPNLDRQMHHKPDERRIPPSIPQLWRMLDAQPGSGPEHVTGAGGEFGSRPPGRLDVMALRDLRTQPGEHDALWSPLRTLLAIAVQLDIRDIDNRPEPIPRSVEGCSTWLHLRLDHLCSAAWVDDAWHDLDQIHRQLASRAGDARARPIGPCQKLVDARGRPWQHEPVVGLRDDGPYECGVPLYLPGQALKGMDEPVELPETLRCHGCRGVYTRAEYKRIGFRRGIEVPA